MSKKVTIIYPPNNAEVFSVSPPLGALYLTSFLQEKKINVDVSDLNILKTWKKKVYSIVEQEPDIVALSSNAANFTNTLYIANLIKEINSNIEIIVGGPYPSCIPEEYLKHKSIDLVCVGEGERTLYEYIMQGNNVNGLMVRRNGNLFFTGERKLIENIDELPFPAIDQVNIKKYKFIFQQRKPISNIITSRGCPFHCTFCFHGVHGHKWRARTPQNVVDEIKWQVNELGVKEFWIADDNFTFNLKRAEKICDLLIKENLDFCWQCTNGIRIDRITKDLLTKMKKAGCYSVALAPETGDPHIIKKIQKGFTLEQTEKVFRWCRELGIFTPIFIIIGFPFDTIKSAHNTMRFLKKVKPDFLSLHKFLPLPKTPIVKEYNIETFVDRGYQTAKLDKELNKMFYKMNLTFYLNPMNILRILKKMGLKYLIKLIFQNIIWHSKDIVRKF